MMRTGPTRRHSPASIWRRKLEILPLRWVNRLINWQGFTFLPLTVGVGRFGIMAESFNAENRRWEQLLILLHWAWVMALEIVLTDELLN